MKREIYHLKFITPCFCAGALQEKGEIRSSAIRGQLRWWFRALGGTAAEEHQVFGGVRDEAASSGMSIRLKAGKKGPLWRLPDLDPNNPSSYVWHFVSVSGKAPQSGAKIKGRRWDLSAAIAPGSVYELEIIHRRPLPPRPAQKFTLALRAFLRLGGMGLRLTRGLGAFHCEQLPYQPDALEEIRSHGFLAETWKHSFPSLDALAEGIGSLVKGTRKKLGWKIDTMSQRPSSISSPLGSSSPRQTSAIYFRPVTLDSSGKLSLVIFEAPHERVLGVASRKDSIVGQIPSQLVWAEAAPRRGR